MSQRLHAARLGPDLVEAALEHVVMREMELEELKGPSELLM